MRFAVMGAGGIGGYFGAMLARAGREVHFIARGQHLEAMRREGLRIRSVAPGEFTVWNHFTDEPASVGPVDVVLFAVKSYHTEAAAEALVPQVEEDTAILTLQNGVDNEEKLAARFGRERVLGGAAYIFSIIAAPGVIAQTAGPRRIVFGELAGGESARGRRLLEEFRACKVVAELSGDIWKELWTKFLFICGLSGITAIARATVGELRGNPGTRELLREVMEEVHRVGLARGVRLDADAVEKSMGLVDGLQPAMTSSLAYDLEHGKRLEVEALFGTVSRYGREAGVPTPANDFLCRVLALEEEKRRKAGGA
ncbi:MAG: 2-dehydropantoate 2-reductase [Nitrospinota bacterium]